MYIAEVLHYFVRGEIFYQANLLAYNSLINLYVKRKSFNLVNETEVNLKLITGDRYVRYDKI